MADEKQKGGSITKAPRVYVDGCFDVFHIGHANAIRQGLQYGNQVVVGSHTDEIIRASKGNTVFSQEERYELVKACRWVGEFIPDAPYSPTIPFLCEHHIDKCLHGEDITLDADGLDAYREMKAAGMYQEIRRAPGISTTFLISKMLAASAHEDTQTDIAASPYAGADGFVASVSKFLTFCEDLPSYKPGQSVCYVEGAWDIFHLGHVRFLQELHKKFDRIICGVFNESVVQSLAGPFRPILPMIARAMSCLQCRYCDDVILDPQEITEGFLKELHITKVVYCNTGTVAESKVEEMQPTHRMGVAIASGIFEEVASSLPRYTTTSVINRVAEHYSEFRARNVSKTKREVANIAKQRTEIDVSEAYVPSAVQKARE